MRHILPIPPYQQALDESGYDFKLQFVPQEKQATRKYKARKRKITWYNPPWDSNVKTNLGRKFLLVVDKCLPNNHPLNKIFNRHKLSYSCMPNMKAVISSHNKNMLAQDHGATVFFTPLTIRYSLYSTGIYMNFTESGLCTTFPKPF